MGGAQSAEDDATADIIDRERGFRVHHVEPSGPGHAAGLESVFDYVCVVDGHRLDSDDGTFVQRIQDSKGRDMKLTVFNTHTLQSREIILHPTDSWGGSGFLGITIRFDLMRSADKHTLHVLDVYDDSPAAHAGLDAFNDYVVGVGDMLFDGPDEFGEIVNHFLNEPVRFFVYSAMDESVREVIITPDRGWGGEGCLGCGVGAGYLHQLPPRRLGRRAAAQSQPRAPPEPEPQLEEGLDEQEPHFADAAVSPHGGPPLPQHLAECT